MIKYVMDAHGNYYKVDFYCGIDENEKTNVWVSSQWWGGENHYLKVHYRHERTWDDHMGNTECGYYCNVPIGGTTRRVYMF